MINKIKNNSKFAAIILVIISICFFNTNVFAVSTYTLSKPTTYEITDTIRIVGAGNGSFSLKFNIGNLSSSSYEKEKSLNVSGSGAKIINSNGAKQLYVSSTIKSNETKVYKVIRRVTVDSIKYNANLAKCSGNYKSFKDYKLYTSPESRIESTNSLIISKAKSLFKGISNPYSKAKKAYEFVNLNMDYNYSSSYSNKGALSALKTHNGVCFDYSALMVALLRASGVPARIATGYWVNSSSSVQNGDYLRHAWVEFYLPQYGWIPAEPTVSYTSSGKKIVPYNYFSSLPNSDHIVTSYLTNSTTTNIRYTTSLSYYTTTTIVKK